MYIDLSQLDQNILKIIKRIRKEADQRSLAIYMVGGIVRDVILGRKNLDLDLVMERDSASFAKALARIFGAKLTVYKQFGTATLMLSNGIRIDLATSRKEHYSHPGALPMVRRGTIREDLLRRDFTINAMAIVINKERFGYLVDEFDGFSDLRQRKIRVLHAKSFLDDPTRILRAVRFEQRFNFKIERKTLQNIKYALGKKLIHHVKPSRYFVEIKKTLMEPGPKRCLYRLKTIGGLVLIDPRLIIDFHLVCFIERNIDKLKRSIVYKNFSAWWFLYMLAIMEKVPNVTQKRLLTKFPFTKREKKNILHISQSLDIINILAHRRLAPSQVYKLLRSQDERIILYMRARTRKSVVTKRIDRFFSQYQHVGTSIGGKDLKKIGFVSGKRIGYCLDEILFQKIDQRITSKREELKLAKQLLSA